MSRWAPSGTTRRSSTRTAGSRRPRGKAQRICEAATQQGHLCFTDGALDATFVNHFWVGEMLQAYAGRDKVYEALTGQRRWDDPLFVEAIALMKDWMDRGWINDGAEGYFSVDFDTSWALLGDGKGVMLNQGSWGFNSAPGAFAESGQEWDWFLFPPLREGVERGFDLSVGDSLAINANSAHPDAAAEVLDWFFNDKARALRMMQRSDLGMVRAAPVDPGRSGGEWRRRPDLRYIDEFSTASGEGKVGYTMWTYWPPRSQQYISQEFDAVLLGDTTPEEFPLACRRSSPRKSPRAGP